MEQIAAILRKHQRHGAFNCHCGERIAADGGESYLTLPEHQAQMVADDLKLHIEGRQLSDGEGGLLTNWKTGEVTSHGRPCTLQIRWATQWINDDGMTLPLTAYVPTP